jgi:hypothetical protein
MNRYWVITPEYGEVVSVTDEGQGPLEYGCDVIEIEADNKRDAIVLGVKAMRANSATYHYYRECDDSPFAGVRAELVPLEEDVPASSPPETGVTLMFGAGMTLPQLPEIVTCQHCGEINQKNWPACWKCRQPLGPPQTPESR